MVKEVMKMKKPILVVISCLLLLGVVGMALVGCGEARVVGNGTQICVFPKAAYSPYSDAISQGFLGINWTGAVEYPGTGSMVIPAWMVTAWGLW